MKFVEKPPKAIAKRLCHIVRVLYYMLQKSISKRRCMMNLNLHLLLERGKIIRKSIGDHLSTAYNHQKKSFYVPQEVEFSCNNTPFHVLKGKSKNDNVYDQVFAIAKAFEMLNSELLVDDNTVMCSSTPRVRQLRVTDSPFPLKEDEEEEGGNQVDREADEFIRRFYEQLRLQQ